MLATIFNDIAENGYSIEFTANLKAVCGSFMLSIHRIRH